MFDFKRLVNTLLVEVEKVPEAEPSRQELQTAGDTIKNEDWFIKIIQKHSNLKYGTIDDNLQNNIIQVALIQRPTEADIQSIIGGIRVLDALTRVLNTRDKSVRKVSKVSYVNTEEFTTNGIAIANKIETLQPGKWDVIEPEINKQYQKVKGLLDKQAAIALNTYNNLSILDATLQIVKRRTDLFSRVINLKSVTQPFSSVVTDIFKQPELYLSGQKAVSTDFGDMVDKLYASDIINIAVAAKDFYATEMDSLKTSTAVDKNTFRNRGKGGMFIKTPMTPEKQKRLQEIKQNTQAYLNFIANKPVTYKVITKKGKETNETKTTEPGIYTIGNIQKIETPESIALINALRSVAQYDRTKPGAGERLAGLQKGLQGVAGFAGAKLYT